MKNKIYFLLTFTAALVLGCAGLYAAKHKRKYVTPDEQTGAIVMATTQFLNTLTADQRAKIQFSFTPQKTATAAKFQRTGNLGGPPNGGEKNMHDQPPPGGGNPPNGRPDGGGPGMGKFPGFVGEQYGQAVWSNFPVSDVPRPGMQLGSLSATQREAAMHMLQELLSAQGYQKVSEIMGSDQALADGGTNFASGKDTYTLAIFGTPNPSTPWMVQFGGHHLGLNIVIAGSKSTLTPTLTGAQPSVYQANGKTIRVLAAENDKAFNLLDALNEGQRKKAILNYKIGDLVLGPGHDGEVIVP